MRSLSIAAVLAAGATFTNGAVSASSAPDEGPTVTISDAGDPSNRIDLSTPPEVGDSAEIVTESVTEGAMTVSGRDLPLGSTATLTQSIEVTSVDGDGFAAAVTMDAIDSTSAFGDSIPDAEDPLAGLVGVTLDYTFSGPFAVESITLADGAPVGGEFDLLVEAMSQLSNVGALAVPDEPVGEGATWTTTLEWNLDATVSAPVVVDVELVSVDGTAFELAYDLEIDAAEMFPLEDDETATGTLAGSGAITGDVAHPMAWASTGGGTVDITIHGATEEDATVSVSSSSTFERTSTPS